MPDQPQQPNRTLSEISHLFLSSIRDRQTGGAPRPQRTPPAARPDASIDLTPEEFAQMSSGVGETRIPPVTAIVASHLSGKQFDGVKRYARFLAMQVGRIGLIELDAAEFRLMMFDRESNPDVTTSEAVECYDPRRMAEAIEEMNWDVDRWLLFLPNPRTIEARALLREAPTWVALSTCDHDGIVGCYRTLKSLSDLHRPMLSLALLDPRSAPEEERVASKMASVCQQFLQWPIEAHQAVGSAAQGSEHLVMFCRPTRDKGQMASAPQWQIVADFLQKAKQSADGFQMDAADNGAADPGTLEIDNVGQQVVGNELMPDEHKTMGGPDTEALENKVSSAEKVTVAELVMPAPLQAAAAAEIKEPAASIRLSHSPLEDQVIDLLGDPNDPADILQAIFQGAGSDFVQCPVRVPGLPSARIAVARDKGLVLLALARQGLTELGAIAKAFQWLIDNRELISMAIPQFALDRAATPSLRLLVEHRDLGAQALRPMLAEAHVSVLAYRKLSWAGKRGLLLEAA